MQENYLAKWLANELTEEELELFKKSPEYESYVKLKKASASLKAPDFDSSRVLRAVEARKDKKETKVISIAKHPKLYRYAAAIVILVATSYFYISTLDDKVSTQYAEREQVVLPDQSEIILNADSEISYSKKDWSRKRKIALEGEAFFKVAKGKKFTVHTSQGQVAVLGTQFNVENRKDFFEVSCYEGLVQVSYKGEKIELPAGSSLVVINGSITHTEVPKNASPSWLLNESTFKSIPLLYVLDELERQYDLEISTQNIDLNQAFTGSFSNTSLNLALQSISTPYQIAYSLEGNKVLFYAESATK
ncbi:FecR family protein [Eudoraea chungangensis]|uniref:FecR family protein n=1 Tax=Eudoraea chungangensis TaxID=1481905 RepID=UPI0023EB4BDD|nr:FecR family protein [Eudoraea chungangensis]